MLIQFNRNITTGDKWNLLLKQSRLFFTSMQLFYSSNTFVAAI